MRRRTSRESGQAAVETAIVMPLFVFLILGLLQLGLMHQARVLTKYAAFKAVRVGAIHNAKKSAMKRAALAVLLPMTGRRNSTAPGAPDSFYKATVGGFPVSWSMAKGGVDKSETDVSAPLWLRVCDPTSQYSGDFDDPDGDMGPGGHAAGDWQKNNRGRLSIQLTNNYQMVIPFANGVIFFILAQQQRAELYTILRMYPEGDAKHKDWLSTRNAANGESRTVEKFVGLAGQGQYIVPIRASWSMRMQSNYLSTNADFKLPTQNFCRVAWQVSGNKGTD